MIPLFVDCSDKQVVIFGGGDVAVRKARRFFKEADVLMISRSFNDTCAQLPVRFREMDIHNAPDETLARCISPAFLVIGALSDPQQNDRIGKLCRQHGTLYNNADGQEGDVIFPAIAQGKNYLLAVSTQGHSPAISRFLREDIEARYPALDSMILLQSRLRDELKTRNLTQPQRSAILGDVLQDRLIWDALAGSLESAWDTVERRYLHD